MTAPLDSAAGRLRFRVRQATPVRCPNCGHEVPRDTRRCADCEARAARAREARAARAREAREARAARAREARRRRRRRDGATRPCPDCGALFTDAGWGRRGHPRLRCTDCAAARLRALNREFNRRYYAEHREQILARKAAQRAARREASA